MNRISNELSERLEAFNNEVIAFVEQCSEHDWTRICRPEDWPVGVTARHIGAGHYEVIKLAEMIRDGKKLPQLSMDDITAMANRHAAEHADCTKPEVIEVLRVNGKKLAEFVKGLSESDLGKSAYFPVMGKDLNVGQFLEGVVLQGAGQHFEHIRQAVAPS
ncbi:MAG: DinB family protein [Desulfobacteraceae bacterium]|nr:DinB family protein [Desulfobacteraceae bacterium]